MTRRSTAPLEAVVLPDLPPPRGNRWLIFRASAAFVALVALAAICVWAVGKLVTASRLTAGDPGSLIDHWEAPQERLTNIAQAMNSRDVGATPAEIRDLQRLFARLTSASGSGDDQAFRDCVDLNLLARRISKHPVALNDRSFSTWTLRSQLESGLSGPTQVGEFSIVRVERGERPDLALVYTVDWTYGLTTACRWWLVRSGRNWRIFDWERLDFEQSMAFGWAVLGTIESDRYSYNYTAQRNASGYQQQGADLASMIDTPLPEVIHDTAKVELAWSLVSQNRPAEAIRACSTLKRPADHPGYLIVRAQAHAALSRHEQALADARQYQEIAGRDPLALTEEADALESLDRYSEAAECWRRMLELAPNHTRALSDFCRLANESQRGMLAEILLRGRQPLATAVQEAQSALIHDDIEMFQWLAAFIESQVPKGVEVDLLKAHRLQYEGQPEQAAALFRQASKRESQPQKKEAYFNEYLSAMAAAGKSAEGYAAADNPRTAFEYLTSGMEEDESIVNGEQLRALVAAHQKRMPEDARATYYAGKLLLDDEKFEAAEAKFRSVLDRANKLAAVAVRVDKDKSVAVKADAANEVIDYTAIDYANANSADEETVELCRNGRIAALYRLGRWREAYQTLEPPTEVFRQLARLFESDGAWDKLRELIDQHRAVTPGDHWIDYYEAKDFQHRDDPHSALAALKRAERGDETLAMYCRWVKTDLLIEANQISEALASADDRSQMFVDLANRMTQNEDWQRVDQLAAVYGGQLTNDVAALNPWTAALWRQGKYDEIRGSLAIPFWKNSTDQPGVMQLLHERRVRSLLRLGRIAEARAAAEQASAVLSYDVPLVMVLLAEGNMAEVSRRLEDTRLQGEIMAEPLAEDMELKQLLLHPDLDALRRKLVWPLHGNQQGNQDRVILFCRERLELTAADLDLRLKRVVLSQAAVVEIPPTEGETRRSYRIDHEEDSLFLTCGPGPYWKPAGQERPPRDPALAASLRDHGGYVAIEHDRSENEPVRKPAAELLGLLAADFCSTNVLAVHGFRQSSGHSRLATLDSIVIEQLQNGQFLRLEPTELEQFYLYDSSRYSDSGAGSNEAAALRSCRQAVTRIARQLRSGQPTTADVCVQVWRGHARERLWLKVVGAKSVRYGGWQLHGELPTDSTLWPHLRAGMRVVVQPYDVVEVRGE